MVEHDILPTDIIRYANDIWSDSMGVLSITEMGKQLGEMADEVSDGTFLWSDVILRGIISLCNSLIISVAISQNTST